MYTTRVSRRVRAPRRAVYRALLDPGAVARWRVPDGMTCEVHLFDARAGGRFRVSLRYGDPAATGKSAEHTDTYSGVFTELVPDERVVEELAFETADPALAGTMRLTTTLTETGDGSTEIAMVHEGVPDEVRPEDNETGTRMALDALARLVEEPPQTAGGTS
ncbi:SRPBCC domain-containing protein [Streptomyces sp. NPDC046887]|uniref:SRPBCC domain-containing protein n=1 Tax=Streptomyces sp. NPDC046887 TaxID=3155472 RepID=UPI0033D81EE1